MSVKDKILKIALPIIIVLSGFAGMQLMVFSRPAPEKKAMEYRGPLVEVMRAKWGKRKVVVKGTGTVRPRQETAITPQVSGKVVFMAPNFVAGGFFREGELLFRIEDTDYRLAIDRARAALAKSEYDLARVMGQAQVAREEWNSLKLEGKGSPNPLVLFEPQLKDARAGVDSAGSALKQAELDLARTGIQAPFDCLVRSEEVDIGQFIQAGKNVATVAGTMAAEIVVPLPLEELQWISVPRGATGDGGSAAKVRVNVGKKALEWVGKVVRSLGEVDMKDRMARVVVSVSDPYNLTGAKGVTILNLEIGTFVDVEIEGKMLPQVISVPRGALRDGNTLWIVDGDMKLRIKPVKVLRRERETLLVRNGIGEGDLVVLTNVPGAAEGMKLRIAGEGGAR